MKMFLTIEFNIKADFADDATVHITKMGEVINKLESWILCFGCSLMKDNPDIRHFIVSDVLYAFLYYMYARNASSKKECSNSKYSKTSKWWKC